MSFLRGSTGGSTMGGDGHHHHVERHHRPALSDVRTLQLNYRRGGAGDESAGRDRVRAAGAGEDPVPIWVLYVVISLFFFVLCCVCSSIARTRETVEVEEQGGRQRRRRRRMMNGRDGDAEEDEAAVAKRMEERRELIRNRIVVKKLVLPSSHKAIENEYSSAMGVEKQAHSCHPSPTPQANSSTNLKGAGTGHDEKADGNESRHVDDSESDDKDGDIEDSSSSSYPAADDDDESLVAAAEVSEGDATTGDKGGDADSDAVVAPSATAARRNIFLGAMLDGIRRGSAYFAHDDVDDEDRDEHITFSDLLGTATAAAHAESCCSICLGDYLTGETVCWSKFNPDCVHVFHEDCLVMWLMDHDECPCCRDDYFAVAGGVARPLEGTTAANISSTGNSTVSISTSDGEDEVEEEGVDPGDGMEEEP